MSFQRKYLRILSGYIHKPIEKSDCNALLLRQTLRSVLQIARLDLKCIHELFPQRHLNSYSSKNLIIRLPTIIPRRVFINRHNLGHMLSKHKRRCRAIIAPNGSGLLVRETSNDLVARSLDVRGWEEARIGKAHVRPRLVGRRGEQLNVYHKGIP